ERGQYGPDELREVVGQMLANLGEGLGESGTDTVFLRSFSVLVLMEMFTRDNPEPLLDHAERDELLSSALDLLRSARQLRGWVASPARPGTNAGRRCSPSRASASPAPTSPASCAASTSSCC